MATKKKTESANTKAGLMNKHAAEVEEINDENDFEETDGVDQKDETIDEKLPRTGKHSVGKSGGHEGLH